MGQGRAKPWSFGRDWLKGIARVLVLAFKPGHDGAVAAVGDRQLLYSLESEKDSYPRYSPLTPTTFIDIALGLPELPDVVALGGWHKPLVLGDPTIGVGYVGVHALRQWTRKFFGKEVTVFHSSHERCHIMMAAGMAPTDDSSVRAVLVYEGNIGSFYVLNERWEVEQRIPVMDLPGSRYGFVFALADPAFPDDDPFMLRLDDSGKLMALAAYGDSADADAEIAETVERIVTATPPWTKAAFRDSPLYNVGVESQLCKIAGALITERIFDIFAAAAREHVPHQVPLYISGGCGLNCDWNVKWRELDHFSSVFVPPCTNDSGSALGTALDALASVTGDPKIDWNVYSGLEFEWDSHPDPAKWQRRELDYRAMAEALENGRIVGWIQGRWEIGPRALGNRSILADASHAHTRERLNEIKQREGYRPIAPCCRLEDAGTVFDDDSPDPYMLYFRRVRSKDLGAVTHVDGTARVQTVTEESNKPLHDLLSAVAGRSGVGVLCNTSLNFKRFGFINRMSDLAKYCEARGLDDMVVGDLWYERRPDGRVPEAPAARRVDLPHRL